jgi:hypothetical protein
MDRQARAAVHPALDFVARRNISVDSMLGPEQGNQLDSGRGAQNVDGRFEVSIDSRRIRD